jgi:hypothetical protein
LERWYKFDWTTLDPKIRNNLDRNGFLKSFGHEQQLPTGNAIPYFCHTHIDKPSIHDYLSQQWLGRGWLDISDPLKNVIIGKVMELYNNAFQHSQSLIGLVMCGQRYSQRGRLHLTLADFGRGIPQTVRSLPENANLSSIDALKWALAEGNSTSDADISGFGLSVLCSFLLDNQGELKIFSNDGYLRIKAGKIEYAQHKVNFSGTLIDLDIQCDKSVYTI